MRLSSCTWIVALLLTVALASPALAEDPPAQDAQEGVAFEPGTPALADVLAKAGAQEKPAFLDFFTDT